jgi:hypothetical protein
VRQRIRLDGFTAAIDKEYRTDEHQQGYDKQSVVQDRTKAPQ